MKRYLISAILASMCLEANAKAIKDRQEWERCREKVESSVNVQEVGNGVEYLIISKCGQPPALEPSSPNAIVGMYPYDIVRSKSWKNKFKQITGKKYKSFIDRVQVASETESKDGWVVGSGIMPHSGTFDEAAFAIDIKSGKIYAAMLEDKKTITRFGFTDDQYSPPFLKEWISNHPVEFSFPYRK